MPATRFLEHGSSNDGADPVAICIRAPGKTPQEAVDWVKGMVKEGHFFVEEEADGEFCLSFASSPEEWFINLRLNVNNITPEMDCPENAEIPEDVDLTGVVSFAVIENHRIVPEEEVVELLKRGWGILAAVNVDENLLRACTYIPDLQGRFEALGSFAVCLDNDSELDASDGTSERYSSSQVAYETCMEWFKDRLRLEKTASLSVVVFKTTEWEQIVEALKELGLDPILHSGMVVDNSLEVLEKATFSSLRST